MQSTGTARASICVRATARVSLYLLYNRAPCTIPVAVASEEKKVGKTGKKKEAKQPERKTGTKGRRNKERDGQRQRGREKDGIRGGGNS